MRLLVSVTGAAEAGRAVAGGADVVDVKDPAEGALGAPSPWVVTAVRAAVPDHLPVSVALGDLPNLPGSAALAALGAARSGAAYVKVGLRGPTTEDEAIGLLRRVREAVAGCGVQVVAAAYADAGRLDGRPLPAAALPRVALAAGVEGCLWDTAIKDGSRLFDWLPPAELAGLVAEARAGGVWLAAAGSLQVADLPRLRALGFDIAGVRSAACAGARRSAEVETSRVRELRAALRA